MLNYNKKNKKNSRHLRNNQTDAELLLWSRVRGKQLNNIQFYRQKPIGNYIVDFYAPKAKLIIEIDGEQHFDEDSLKKDSIRDNYLNQLSLKVLRFNNLQVLQFTDDVVEVIFNEILKAAKSPRRKASGRFV
jgi:very-short-patch-repair endonuclease